MKIYLQTTTIWSLLFVLLESILILSHPIDLSDIENELQELDGRLFDDNDRRPFDAYNSLSDIEEYPDVCVDYDDENCADEWVRAIEVVYKRNQNRMSNVQFRQSTNINHENEELVKKYQRQAIPVNRKIKIKAGKFKWKEFRDPTLVRIFQLITPSIMNSNLSVSLEISRLSRQISSIYNKARPTVKGRLLSAGEYDIESIFHTDKDYDRLKNAWVSWRNVTGVPIRDLYLKRMNLINLGATENGYSNAMEFNLKQDFEQDNFDEVLRNLLDEIFPFYQQLHGYVRHCLWKYYDERFDKNGPIPAHILGNVWAQQWTNIAHTITKCMNRRSSDDNIQTEADETLADYKVTDMFRKAEGFFKSLGMFKMTDNFWDRSMFKKPNDKVVDCHGSAYDFSNGVDFRIKMCTKKNLNDFTTIHHEMGHIEYYMAYSKLPLFFQSSANSGFHEAIGDTIALSVKTPEHLEKIGLINSIPNNENFDLKALMTTALEKIVFLPFAITMESFTWGVFNGSVDENEMNAYWWKLRNRYQGLSAPVKRTENDFDAGAKYHIAMGIPYSRYFVSFLLQFQFYESMCNLSGYRGRYLHRCDFYNSREAGEKFLKMLSKGQSQPWPKTLKILTGSEKISANSILKYFKPLHEWLIKTNKDLNIKVGW